MRLLHLVLTNFRNYVRLNLAFPHRITILQGANAQGKSSLLEAIHFLATARSPQTTSDRELINWLALEEELPFARAVAEIAHDDQRERLEITIMPGNQMAGQRRFRKQIRINGVNRRALDLVGRLRVVLFQPQDIDLVAGPPTHRRRYLDLALCQLHLTYCQTLVAYNQALAQRNALLKRLREHRGRPGGQLQIWNDPLVEYGAFIIAERARFVAALDMEARQCHRRLTAGEEWLQVRYQPALPDWPAEGIPSRIEIKQRFHQALRELESREIAAGVTLLGPHRDDLQLTVAQHDLRTYGSRGQQRTAALAMKLAEMQVMTEEGGEPPLLLLDDVMSELDATRRAMLLDTIRDVGQVIMTTTDWDDFSADFLSEAHRLQVVQGQISEVAVPTP